MDFVFLYFMISLSVANATLRGPQVVNGNEGDSVQITCTYHMHYRNYQKYWCKSRSRSACTVLVKTQGSEETISEGRISIKDDKRAGEFTVTMDQLTLNDQGMYWCGIMRFLMDLQTPVKLDIFESHQLLPPVTDYLSAQEIGKISSKYYFIWNILRWIFFVILLLWGIVAMRI
ncbi:CMRF35-like molecule 5 [Hemitrygon akajei]|uniref:CMRF35-like molecule 5 n=1 Tax=Hemitrygon akajei TaxID=2704970 RepID=UPI003BFA3201